MSQKVIITVAPTGSISTKKDNPNLPVTPEEIAVETLRSYNAGASLVHLHARDQRTVHVGRGATTVLMKKKGEPA